MYISKIEIKNSGPINHVSIDLPFGDSGKPKPLIIVGENGSGKSIVLSYLVNTLISAKQSAFEDSEVERGVVYKYRSPQYIKTGANYSYGKIYFTDENYVEEWQLNSKKSDFEEIYGFCPLIDSWRNISADSSSDFKSSFSSNKKASEKLFQKQCCLYFPVNRFEEPAWLNIENLKERAVYTDLRKISGYSNRNLISIAPLKSNRNWLLDLIFDRQAFEISFQEMNVSSNEGQVNVSVFKGFQGQSSRTYEAVIGLLAVMLGVDGKVRLGAGSRHNRKISIVKDEAAWIPDIFQLSTGEVLLLNLFLSIIRDYDLSAGSLESLSDISGVVVVDEIDAHLHTRYQKDVLPELIASFPNVQFIITTHSPLFLLGMEKKFGSNGFKIINMPNGEMATASDFSEFMVAYEAFRETNAHRKDITKALEDNSRPIVFVEGDYDIRYINKAAELLAMSHLLELIQLRDATGFGNLDKIWRSYEIQIAEILPSKILLLYDCDTNKTASEKGKVIKRVIPSMLGASIHVGIENLFPNELIARIEISHPQFIDSTKSTVKKVRGEDIIVPEIKSVNKDEKKSLCDWLCVHGTKDDFINFLPIFEIIKNELLGMSSTDQCNTISP